MKLFRISNLLSLGVACFMGVLLYLTSQKVQQAENDLAKTRQAMASENESVRVLSAEWDYLTRPQRIEELARDTLKMVPSDSGDTVAPSADVLPEMPAAESIQVSSEPAAKNPPDTISNAERQNFDALIGDVTAGDAP